MYFIIFKFISVLIYYKSKVLQTIHKTILFTKMDCILYVKYIFLQTTIVLYTHALLKFEPFEN